MNGCVAFITSWCMLSFQGPRPVCVRWSDSYECFQVNGYIVSRDALLPKENMMDERGLYLKEGKYAQ